MRSLLITLSFVAASAAAQINPGTQIRWPQPSCGTLGSFYEPAGNICITETNSGALPIANPQFAGTMQGPAVVSNTVNASVNGKINPMAAPYNATGDCVTDDSAAFTAAQADAVAKGGSSGPMPMEIPQPPGGCYIVSMIWQGVPLIGIPTGVPASTPVNTHVTLKSKPGLDVLNIPDPKTTSGAIIVYTGPRIENINFVTDTTVTHAFPHRFPGRWFDDGAMTAGSNILTTLNGLASCGDVGQAVQVNGAGPGGTNLVTTISSIWPCWATVGGGAIQGWQVIQLAANAGTTVSNAHTYISLLGLPVTSTVGNCGIAQDMQDGNSANWTALSYNVGNESWKRGARSSSYNVSSGWTLRNVVFNTTNPGGNQTCGIFMQGAPTLYDIDVLNFGLYSLTYGIVQVCSELNSSYQSCSGDFEKWDHGDFQGWEPWVSVNGLSQRIQSFQLSSDAGPQINGTVNQYSDFPNQWYVDVSSDECPYGTSCTNYGWHVTGLGHYFLRTPFVGTSTQIAYLDTYASTYEATNVGGNSSNVHLNGNQNTVHSDDGILNLAANEQGMGNQLVGTYDSSPLNSLPYNHPVSRISYKGSNDMMGRFTGDNFRDGNLLPIAYNNDDLILFPRDLTMNGTKSQGVNAQWYYGVYYDSTSPSGSYFLMDSSRTVQTFVQFEFAGMGSNPKLIVGQNLPQTGATIYFSAKCPTPGTEHLRIALSGGTAVFGGGSCTSSYQTFSVEFPWGSGHSGESLGFQGNGSDILWVAWIMVVPYKGSVNGMTFAPGGQQIPTQPSTATVVGDLPTYDTTTGHLHDSGINFGGKTPILGPGTATPANKVLCTQDALGNVDDCMRNAIATQTVNMPPIQLSDTSGVLSGVWLASPNAAAGAWTQPYSATPADWYVSRLRVPGAGGVWNFLELNAGTQGAGGQHYILPGVGGTVQIGASGVTASIGGSSLAAGACATSTFAVANITTSEVMNVSPAGAGPGAGFVWQGWVSSAGNATVEVCAIVAGTPTASTYNWRIVQ